MTIRKRKRVDLVQSTGFFVLLGVGGGTFFVWTACTEPQQGCCGREQVHRLLIRLQAKRVAAGRRGGGDVPPAKCLPAKITD